jgi:hypothetical protein
VERVDGLLEEEKRKRFAVAGRRIYSRSQEQHWVAGLLAQWKMKMEMG